MSDPTQAAANFDDREEVTVGQSEATELPGRIPMPPVDGAATVGQDEPTQIQAGPSGPAAKPPNGVSIEEWLNKLRSSDRAFYNIMAMEVWSLAKSMDTIVPGFWSRFMVNRRHAMREFMSRRRRTEDGATADTQGEPTVQQDTE